MLKNLGAFLAVFTLLLATVGLANAVYYTSLGVSSQSGVSGASNAINSNEAAGIFNAPGNTSVTTFRCPSLSNLVVGPTGSPSYCTFNGLTPTGGLGAPSSTPSLTRFTSWLRTNGIFRRDSTRIVAAPSNIRQVQMGLSARNIGCTGIDCTIPVNVTIFLYVKCASNSTDIYRWTNVGNVSTPNSEIVRLVSAPLGTTLGIDTCANRNWKVNGMIIASSTASPTASGITTVPSVHYVRLTGG